MRPKNLHFQKFPADPEPLAENHWPELRDVTGFIELASVTWQGAVTEEIGHRSANFDSGRQEK